MLRGPTGEGCCENRWGQRGKALSTKPGQQCAQRQADVTRGYMCGLGTLSGTWIQKAPPLAWCPVVTAWKFLIFEQGALVFTLHWALQMTELVLAMGV